ncbi:MAG: peptidase [Actinobacteria bacterium]|nr:MAG: peptidase [Actinomycetota bacterium]
MRLYLSSFRMGDRSEQLPRLVGGAKRVAVIANAMDGDHTAARSAGVEREVTALSTLGFRPEELDLRAYFNQPEAVEAVLADFGLVWLRGGNVFMLRYALHRAGADEALARLLHRDALVYAGYSAGPCVLGPTIRGFERTDDPWIVQSIYGGEPLWTGMGILDFVVVPHVDSPEHPASAALSRLAAAYEADGVPYRALRDGEVLVIDGPDCSVY